MAYLVSHSGGKLNAANSILVHRESDARDHMFRLEHNGAVGVSCRELTDDEYRAEKAKRLPPHLRHLAGV